ncbi:hypothetical protein G8D99_04095 [Acinetobacter lanii]|uniref:Bacterial Ig domain-containing protein n=1 Tax=Acinetobacter lanii TaxID=2715163 RepID=A0A6G8S2T3_9GAMM|nr:Ig-like domain-containing protein [Acinetobacter lanii]QIO08283.1 hypothetical protein G8D99_04095 [Acinetobacter lanii]
MKEDGTWEVENPGNLEDGDEVTAEAKDPAGNVSDKDKEIVDGIAPTTPSIDPINPKDPITGTGEEGSEVTVTYPDGSTATTTVKEDGTWEVENPGNLEDGDEVTAEAKDLAGNVSDKDKEIVDGIAPTTPSIDPINPKDPITGTGEEGSEVTVTYPDGSTATTTVKEDGTWEVENPGNLEDGDEVTAEAKDPAGNVSDKDKEIVDGIAPTTPSIDPINPKDPITGTGEEGSEVTVTYPDGSTATTTVKEDGTWEVENPGNLEDGDEVTAEAKDPAGNVSDKDKEIVDGIAPTTPSIDPINPKDPITGTGEEGSEVTVTYPDGSTATTTVKEDGTWEVENPGNLEDGDEVTAEAKDPAGNVSDKDKEIVDGIAPATPSIDPINPKDPITGTGEEGSEVTVTYPDGSTATTTVKEDGTWEVENPGNLEDGDEVTAEAKDPAGNVSDKDKEIVDGTAPTAPDIDPIGPNLEYITGTADPKEAGNTVTVSFPDGTTATASIDAAGNWKVTTPAGLKDGDEVKAIITDAAGNVSPEATEIVDGVGPTTEIDPINAIDPITGTGEPDSIVKVTYPDGSSVTTQVDADGNWTVANPGLKDGDIVKAVATDAVGNVGPEATSTVDGTAPTAPDIDPIGPNLAEITGTADPKEAGNTVTVSFPDGTTATAIIDAAGNWKVATPAGLKDGDEVKAIITDAAGNISPEASEIVDGVGPTTNIDPINANDPITGTGEAGSIVKVTYPDGSSVTTQVDADGNWTVANLGLNDGDEVKAIGTDPVGNVGPEATATVDGTAPTAPGIDPIGPNLEYITGTADPKEAGNTVTVSFPDGTTATASIDAAGNWKVATPAGLKDGDEVKAIINDAAGNVSPEATEIVDGVGPTTTIDPINAIDPITGTGEAGSTVTVTYPDGKTTATAEVDADGNWTVANPGLQDGDIVKAVATDPVGNVGPEATATVDGTAPTAPDIDPIGPNLAEITGTADPKEAGNTVTVSFPNSSPVTAIIEADGSWKVTTPAGLKDGDEVKAIITDAAGNVSPEASEIVDGVGPTTTIDPINANDPITGTGEKGSTVEVTYPNGDKVTTPVAEDGTWSVANPGLKDGDIVKAVATDPVGNVGPEATSTVDGTAPTAPEIDPIGPNLEYITGTADPKEAGNTVTVSFPNSSPVTAIIEADGTWKVATPAGLKDGDEVKAIITDAAGNVSPEASEIVDGVGPTTTIDPINANDPITGTGEKGSTVEVTYPNGTSVTTQVDADGNWTVANPGLNDGDEVKAIGTDPVGNVGPEATATVDGTAPTAPEIDPIGPNLEYITGTADPKEAGNTVTVSFPDGTTATASIDAAGNWKVTTPAGLKDGDEVKAIITDAAGNVSPEASEIVDGVGPTTNIDPINANDPITGTGEVGSTVTVTYPDGKTTATAEVDADGNWTVANPGLQDGDIVKAVATDPVGNVGPEATATVDGTAPTAPDIDPIGPNLEYITGTADPKEAGNTVTVSFPDGTTATASIDAAGNWKVTTPAGLKDGDEVKAIITDAAGNVSPEASEIVDGVGPTTTIDPINANDPITGTGEKGSTVEVTYPNGDKVTTPVAEDGTWSVANPGLKDGDIVKAVATDPVGNVGPEATATVDGTAPTAPEIDPIGPNLEYITGTADPKEAGNTVTVSFPNSSPVTAIIEADGTWKVATPAGLKDGDEVKAIITDAAGNVSPEASEIVDGVGPTTTIDPINANDPITGTGEKGSTVEVTYPNGTSVTTQVDADGNWTVANPGLKDGDIVKAVATDPVGNVGPEATATVDGTAPTAPDIDPIGPNLAEITGTADPKEAGNTVTVSFPDGTTATASIDADGSWKVTTPAGLKDGDEVKAIITDAAGNVSPEASEIVDGVGPTTTIDPINANDPITGTGEKGSTVTVTYPDGKTTATAEVDADGNWTVANPGLKDGDIVKAVATDPVGNVGPEATATVDGTAPTAPDIDPIGPNLAEITGTADPKEAGNTVTVSFPNSSPVTAIIEADGTWKVATPAGLKDGDEVKAIITDAAGNVSPEASEIVDGVGPTTTIDPINANDPITGTGEKGSTVEVTYPNGTSVTTQVDADGNWTVANPGLNDGDEVKAIGTDPVGNVGPEATATVDGTAPTAPEIDPIGPNLEYITGTADPKEAGNTVTVSFPDGTTATASIDAAGNWKVTTPAGLKDGDEVKAIITDAAGNVSPEASEIVDGVGPTTTIDPINANDPITGTGEKGSTVEVTYPNGDKVTTPVAEDGTWSVANPGLKDGDIVKAVATDPVGNVGPEATATVDGTAPTAPEIDPIGPNLEYITGTARSKRSG